MEKKSVTVLTEKKKKIMVQIKVLKEDGSFQLIRRAETPMDYFATLDCTEFQFHN